MKKPAAVIFDMDGVIVDNQHWHFEAYVEFGRRHNLNISKEQFGIYFGITNQAIMKLLFNDTVSETEIGMFGEEKEKIYRELYKPFIEPVKGLPEFLRNIASSGIPIALATSAPRENVDFTLTSTGLKKYFEVITDASMVNKGKPDPHVYLVTAEKLGIQPQDCLVFEDSVPGIQSAIKAGMRVVGVATTHKYVELSKYVNEIILNFEAAEKLLYSYQA